MSLLLAMTSGLCSREAEALGSSAAVLSLSPQPRSVRLHGQPRQRFTADTARAAASAPAASSAQPVHARSPAHPDNDPGTSRGRRRRVARRQSGSASSGFDRRTATTVSILPSPSSKFDRAPPPRRRSKAVYRLSAPRCSPVQTRPSNPGWQPQRCAKMAGNAAPAHHAPRRSVHDPPRSRVRAGSVASFSRFGLLSLVQRREHGIGHHARQFTHALLDRIGHVVVISQELLGVLPALTDPLAVATEPGTGLFHHACLYPQVDQLANLAEFPRRI